MPDAPEIHALVRELHHRSHEWAFRKPSQLRIFHRFAERAREREQRLRRELLLVQKNYQVIEPRLPDFCDDLSRERTRDVDAAHLGAERAGDRANLDVLIAAMPADIEPLDRVHDCLLESNYLTPAS